MNDRRNFIKSSAALALSGLSAININNAQAKSHKKPHTKKQSRSLNACTEIKPTVISTWNFALEANKPAWSILNNGGTALDAVEQGVRIPESDETNHSVGYGGFPDREGIVTLDASIMDHNSNCGAVACLEGFKHPISIARKVMEETPHVMLVGKGAQKFALSQGFKKQNLLTEKAKQKWHKWLTKSDYTPVINVENHDTIGMLALDSQGHLAGATSTSGVAWKMHGRVGDSPIIGAGLFVDNEIGAVACTGLGEAVIRTGASTVVMEMMRAGKTPQQACEIATHRIHNIHKNHHDMKYLQVAFIAINRQGHHGAFSLRGGFQYAIADHQGNKLHNAGHILKWS
jgi:N4-(beta-N-acetylglucosaminyl)-L-asparaginase